MKVKELIELLQNENPELPVLVSIYFDGAQQYKSLSDALPAAYYKEDDIIEQTLDEGGEEVLVLFPVR